MRYFLLLAVAFLAVACQKQNDSFSPPPPFEIVGVWKVKSNTCPVSFSTIQFTADLKFTTDAAQDGVYRYTAGIGGTGTPSGSMIFTADLSNYSMIETGYDLIIKKNSCEATLSK